MKNIEKSTIEYKESFGELSADLSFDLYKLIISNMIPIRENRFEEFKKMFEAININSLYENWRKFQTCLPHVTDKLFLLSKIDWLDFLILHLETNLRTIKVDYNNPFYLELDEFYKRERLISVYEVIESNFRKKIELSMFVKTKIKEQIKILDDELSKVKSGQEMKILELEKFIAEKDAKLSSLEANQKNSQIKYRADQTKVISFYLIGIRLGIFYDPDNEKIFEKLVDNALFFKKNDNIFQPALSPGSIISRIRKGGEKNQIKNKNKKIRAEIIKELELILKEMEDPKANINIFNF
jgi:hypothetical protein